MSGTWGEAQSTGHGVSEAPTENWTFPGPGTAFPSRGHADPRRPSPWNALADEHSRTGCFTDAETGKGTRDISPGHPVFSARYPTDLLHDTATVTAAADARPTLQDAGNPSKQCSRANSFLLPQILLRWLFLSPLYR